MLEMMQEYTKEDYCQLAGHGYRILCDAIASDRQYDIPCPAMLLCGACDKAGSARIYNRRWAKREGLQLQWIAEAGHNSNVDRPDLVNAAIESLLQTCHKN